MSAFVVYAWNEARAVAAEVEALVERHRAVVAGTDRDAVAVQDLGDVVRVDAREVERDDAAAEPGGRAVDLDAGHLAREHLERVGDELALVVAQPVHAQRRGGSRPPTPSPIWAEMSGVPASNFHGIVVPLGAAEVDLADHVAAAHERGHRLEQLATAPQDARSPWGRAPCARRTRRSRSRWPPRRPAGAARPGRRRRARARRPRGPCGSSPRPG